MKNETCSLLIVDDEPIIREGLALGVDWLSVGFQVAGCVATGEEALLFLEQGLVDVILTDIRMPVMDGIELIRKSKTSYPSIRYVILSGYESFTYAKSAIALGVIDYIVKPINDDELLVLFQNIHDDIIHQRQVALSANKQSPIHQTEILHRLLFPSSDQEPIDSSNIASLLQQPIEVLEASYVQIVILSLKSADANCETDEFYRELFALLKLFCEREAVPVMMAGKVFLFFFQSQSRKSPDMIVTFCLDLLQNIRTSIMNNDESGVDIHFGIGQAEKGVNGIQRSAMSAQTQLTRSHFYQVSPVGLPPPDASFVSAQLTELLAQYQPSSLIQDYMRSHRVSAILSPLSMLFERIRLLQPEIDPLCLRMIDYARELVTLTARKYAQKESADTESLFKRLRQSEHYDQFVQLFLSTIQQWLDLDVGDDADTEHHMIVRIKRYIYDNYQNKLNLQNLSDAFYLNASYLSTLFKKKTGQTLSDYLHNVRMEKACQLLTQTRLSIGDIAKQVGYGDYRHFSTVFKKEYGISPFQYRLDALQ